ncbi:MAG: DUF3313 domain-containing protein [Methylococcaceae bacterium]|nr:DUF3313 domain-containing protein [Methylococcaceae bacterium]
MKIDSKKIKKNSVDMALSLCIIGALSGCSYIEMASNDAKAVAVEPAPNAGFIEQPDRDKKIAYIPFQRAWIKPGFEKSHYKEIVVAPVNTQYMLKMDWLHDMSSASWFGDVKKDIDELAVYFHDQIVKEFEVIEIDPSTPVLHAAGWAVPGGSSAAGVVNQRRAAFEGRLRDLQTGKIVATFADRNMADIGPIDLTRLTWYGPAKGIMDMWAKQFVQIANRKPGEIITDPVALTLRPF